MLAIYDVTAVTENYRIPTTWDIDMKNKCPMYVSASTVKGSNYEQRESIQALWGKFTSRERLVSLWLCHDVNKPSFESNAWILWSIIDYPICWFLAKYKCSRLHTAALPLSALYSTAAWRQVEHDLFLALRPPCNNVAKSALWCSVCTEYKRGCD